MKAKKNSSSLPQTLARNGIFQGMRRRPITLMRRIVQISTFILITYGVLLGIPRPDLPWVPFIEPAPGFQTEDRVAILMGPPHYQIFDTYLPIKTCRFKRGTGMFRACFLHFASEGITWVTPLSDFLPHLLIFIGLAFLLGTFWCGWVCPLGTLTDALTVVRRTFGLGYLRLPKTLREFLAKFKYLLLAFILLISLVIAFPFIPWPFRKGAFIVGCQICPSRFIFTYLTGFPPVHTLDELLPAIFFYISAIFFLIFLMSFFIRRSYCRFCPSGAILSFFNRGGGLSKEKDPLRCTRCGICLTVCPVDNTNVYEEKRKKSIDYPRCIRCGRCVELCPEKDCLKVKFLGKTIFKSRFKP